MNMNKLTGRASVDRPWMKLYPEVLKNLQVPACTLMEYLKMNCPGEDVVAMHYYGNDIKWSTVFENAELTARALKAMGFGEGDQIPVFFQAVPEMVYVILAAEKIGASLLCRDNTLEENVEAVRKSKAEVILAHDYLGQKELEKYLSDSSVKRVVLLDPCYSCKREEMPDYIQKTLDSRYPEVKAGGPATIDWNEFLALGEKFDGEVEAQTNVDRPLFRAYTSGSTGPSKQVIHSAHTMIGVVHQLNFYAGADGFRPSWMIACLPPALIAVTVSGILMPLASNKLLILNPFCDPMDIDLEMMRYRPSSFMMIPWFVENIMHNGRIADDYDMSYLLAAGLGCEAYNNKQLENAQEFLKAHNCNARFTTGYGSSEAGSSMTLPLSPHPVKNGNVGIPMVCNVMSVFKPGTQEELTYHEMGEICVSGPGLMLGYDNPEATAEVLQMHEDGMVWLHTGDLGYMDEDGVVYVQTRGKSPRHGGGDLATLPMENRLADAEIEGINDEFFVVVPDTQHTGCFLPYLFVILKDGYTVDDIEDEVRDCLEDYMQPVEIVELPERPFFHFKTNRIGLTQEILSRKIVKKNRTSMAKRAVAV